MRDFNIIYSLSFLFLLIFVFIRVSSVFTKRPFSFLSFWISIFWKCFNVKPIENVLKLTSTELVPLQVKARQKHIHQQWEHLNWLKAQKEKSLEGASSVELFERTCDEARDWMREKMTQLETAVIGE